MSKKPQDDWRKLYEVMHSAHADGDDNILYSVVKYCVAEGLEVPEWAQEGAEGIALARLMNPTPRTGRHANREVRAQDHLRDIKRWEVVVDILKRATPEHRVTLYNAFGEAEATLAQRFPKDRHKFDAVRRSYFRVQKDPVWYLLVAAGLARAPDAELAELKRAIVKEQARRDKNSLTNPRP